jgi:DNA-binding transcriptional MocR family regulator
MLSPSEASGAVGEVAGASRGLSRRGTSIAAVARMPLPALTGGRGHPAAFQLGLPGLDAFPAKTWAKLHAARLRRSRRDLMQYGDPLGYRPQAALQTIDHSERVLYVGTFSKVIFPGLRLGYVVVPADLVDGFAAAHLSTDVHAHVHDQAVLADIIHEGHFDRHLRRMRVLCRQRQDILVREAQRLGPRVHVEASDAGVHLVAWLRPDADDRAVADAAAARGVNLWPLSLHVLEGQWPPALLLGYAGANERELIRGIDVLHTLCRRSGKVTSRGSHRKPGSRPPWLALPAVIACTRTDAARVAAALRAAARGVVGLTPSLGQTDHP